MTELDTKSAKECRMRGLLGEKYLVKRLKTAFRENGMLDDWTIFHASEENENAPFDVEIRHGGRILIGFENKDLWFRNGKIVGTTIRKYQIKRKKEYAFRNNVESMVTTITLRDKGMVGFHDGLVNRTVEEFDFDIQKIVEACEVAVNGKS